MNNSPSTSHFIFLSLCLCVCVPVCVLLGLSSLQTPETRCAAIWSPGPSFSATPSRASKADFYKRKYWRNGRRRGREKAWIVAEIKTAQNSAKKSGEKNQFKVLQIALKSLKTLSVIVKSLLILFSVKFWV